MQIIRDIPQNTPEWMQLRLASVGSTAINEIAPKGAGYKNCLYKMAGELVTGVKADSKTFRYADRGHEYEPAVREHYEFVKGVDVEEICMIKGDKPHTHTSTDGLVGDAGIFEAKVRIPSVFLKLLDGKTPPIADLRQCWWDLYISKRDWVDYVNYCPEIVKAKRGGYIPKRIYRKECEPQIKELADVADVFVKGMLNKANAL